MVLGRVRDSLVASLDVGVAPLAVPEITELHAFPAAATVPPGVQLLQVIRIHVRDGGVQVVELAGGERVRRIGMEPVEEIAGRVLIRSAAVPLQVVDCCHSSSPAFGGQMTSPSPVSEVVCDTINRLSSDSETFSELQRSESIR